VPDETGAPPGADASISLSVSERKLLSALRSSQELPVDEESLPGQVGEGLDAVRGSLQRLRSKRLVVVHEEHASIPRLTPRGEATATAGLPERRLFETLRRRGSLGPDEISAEGLEGEERSAAIGILRRQGLLAEGMPLRWAGAGAPSDPEFPEEAVLRSLSRGEPVTDPARVRSLERRGLVRIEHRSRKRWAPSEEGRALVLAPEGVEAIGGVTSSLLASGGWKDRPFRPYDVRAPVPRLQGARPNPYVRWLHEFEEMLLGLGFEEAEGPLLETEFWNNDVLFMPQDHPARSIHDALAVVGVAGHGPSPDLLARVASVHEGRPLPGEERPLGPGWATAYDPSIAARPVLRSQTTAVSGRYLATRPRPPFRMYSVDRVFRREEIDAQHHLEFHQSEGIVGAEGLTIRHLLGLFRAFAEGIGVREIKFRPSYFPFTEPSIEGYVRHPRLGWMEVFPGGMLRPEVLRPLGIDVPVLAWGIGVARLAMVALGVNDIRELFSDDLDALRGTGR
jgi:phenylalanyl-tRNA synthetase alpha chain